MEMKLRRTSWRAYKKRQDVDNADVRSKAVVMPTLGKCWFRSINRRCFFVAIFLLLFGLQFLWHSYLKDNDDQRETQSDIKADNKAEKHVTTPVTGTTKEESKLFDDLLKSASCEVKGKDVLSALKRASPLCKKQIIDVACLVVYPEWLPNTCPLAGRTNSTNLGCYQDSLNDRLLKGRSMTFRNLNTRKKCIDACFQAGFAYAGVQFAIECFCGVEPPKDQFLIDETGCNKSCPGEASETCGGYLTMNVHQTGMIPFKPLEASGPSPANGDDPARVVYLLTVSGRAVRQVRRLISHLYDGRNYFYIHVDSRQDYMYRELSILQDLFPDRVYVASKRWATIWGGASLLSMLLGCMSDLLQNLKHWKWDFVLNLSESNYPLKKGSDLVQFLSGNRGKNFVKAHGRVHQTFIRKQGLEKTFFECDAHMWRIGDRPLPLGIQLDGGSDWICLSRDFVEFLTYSIDEDELLRGLRTIFKYSLLAAESFFHTVLRNSKFCSTYVNNNLHLTNWHRSLGCKCQQKAVVDWCGCSPNVFIPATDWTRLTGTEEKNTFFGRKFEPSISQNVIDMVDEWVYGDSIDKSLLDSASRKSYWQNIYHHLDASPSPDPPTVALARLLAERSIQLLDNGGDHHLLNVLEVTSHHQNDTLKGTLISFLTYHAVDGNLEFEALVEHKEDRSTGKIDFRRGTFSAGTNFDPKERIFRNLFRAFGQASQMQLLYSIDEYSPEQKDQYKDELEEAKLAANFAWVDPLGKVVCTDQLRYSNTSGVTDVLKPNSKLKQPMRSGIWTVLVFEDTNLLTKFHFLVVADKKHVITSDASTEDQNEAVNKAVEKLFFDDPLLQMHREANSVMISEDEEAKTQAVLSMSSFLYDVKSICISSSKKSQLTTDGLPPCTQTSWSSKFPDPKSSISKFDFGLGRLV